MDEDEKVSLDAKEAYEAIAPVYDDFTAGHDFDLWLRHLLPKMEEHGLEGNRLLDVGCGTGRSFMAMLRRGWSATACDISPAMLEVAEEKAQGRVELRVADMRFLPKFGEFDLVWALDDAVNYLLSPEELEQALAGMRANLADGGRVVFDVNTLRVYRSFFAAEVVVESGRRQLIWKGRADPDFGEGGIAEASFREVPPKGAGSASIPAHVHRQRHYPVQCVLEAMEASDLKCLGIYGHEDDAVPEQPLEEERHTKAVFIACAA